MTLLDAVKAKDVEAVNACFDAAEDPNQEDVDGWTPLIRAAQDNEIPLLELLLSHGADINCQNKTAGETALYQTAYECRIEAAKYLLLHDADSSLKTKNGKTVLDLAREKGHNELISLLLAWPQGALHVAVENGFDDMIQSLINTGVDVDSRDSKGRTALMVCKSLPTAKILVVTGGAGLDHRDASGNTALIHAITSKNKEIAAFLLVNDASVDPVNAEGTSAFLLAASFGDKELLEQIIIKGADVNQRNKSTDSALMVAIQNDAIELPVIQLLLAKKIDVNMSGESQETALHRAAKAGKDDIVTALVNAGADVNARDDWGATPLLAAIYAKKESTAKLLIERGTDLTIVDGDGDDALMNAAWAGLPEVVDALLAKNTFDLNAVDYRGCSLLIQCIKSGFEDIGKTLLAKGAGRPIGGKDDSGSSVIHYAAAKGYTEFTTLALDAGASINQRDLDGNTPLLIALSAGFVDLAKLLLEKKADASLSNYKLDETSPLHVAAEKGFVDIVNTILECPGIDLDFTDSAGNTPLILAIKGGFTDIAKTLIEKGASISVANNDGDTAFLLAADKNHVDVVTLLLEKKAPIDQRDVNDNTALIRSIRKADSAEALGVAKLLIEKKANISLINNVDGDTALIAATKKGFSDLVVQFLDAKLSIEVFDKNGSTPLLLACENKFSDLAKLLIERGADVNIANYELNTPILCASRNGDTDLARLLFEKGVDFNAISGSDETPLICAASGADGGFMDIVDMLIDRGVNLDYVDSSGYTALMHAIKKTNIDIARRLVEKGASIENIKNNRVSTPLILAADGELFDIVLLLLNKGADVPSFIDQRDAEGYTALMKGIQKGNVILAKTLLQRGASVAATSNSLNCALLIAAEVGLMEIVQLLLSKKADINSRDKEGNTALIRAIVNNKVDIANHLIEKEADVSIMNNDADNAFFLAVDRGLSDTVQLLLKRDVNVNQRDKAGNSALLRALSRDKIDLARLLIEKEADITVINNDGMSALQLSTDNAYADIVQSLLKRGVNIYERGKDGSTALMRAIKSGHGEITHSLLDRGSDLVATRNDGMTALFQAIESFMPDVVQSIIFRGVNLNQRDREGNTALIRAIQMGHTDVAIALIVMGADVKLCSYGVRRTAFLAAANSGQAQIVQLLAERDDISIDQQDGDGNTALILAIRNGSIDLAKFLISKRADPCVMNNDWSTALMYAVDGGHKDLMESLVQLTKENLDLQDKSGRSALMRAINKGFVAIALYLLRNGASYDVVSNSGETALLLSANNCSKTGTPLYEVLYTLIDNKNDDINRRSNDGMSVLLQSVKLGRVTLVRRILALESIEYAACDNDGVDSLYYAADTNRPQIVRMLVEKGSDINLQYGLGNTPLLKAIDAGSITAAIELLSLKANVSLVNNDGDSAIFLAVRQGYLHVLKLIIAADSNVNVVDNMGNIPILRAQSIQSRRCAIFLIERNIDLSIGENFLLQVASNSLLQFADILIDLTERGIDINVVNPKTGVTLLMHAIKNGFVGVARVMIRKGANITLSDFDGNTALDHAAVKDFVDIMHLALQQGVSMDRVNKAGDSCLVQALDANSIAAARLLISKEVNVNALKDDKSTALMLAAYNGQLGIAKQLVNLGSNINAVDIVGDTALMYALKEVSVKRQLVATYLIQRNINCALINDYYSTALIKASGIGNYQLVRMIFEKEPANLSASDVFGNSAVLAGRPYPDTVNFLLNQGADLNAQNENADSVLLRSYDQVDLVRNYLALNTLDLDVCDSDGCTAFLKAVESHLSDIAILLIDNGCNMNVQSDDGKVAVMNAAVPSCVSLLERLIQEGCDINQRDNSGNTALHFAIAAGYTDLVKFLLSKGADVRIQNNEGENALLRAVTSGIFDVVTLLVDSDVDINARDKGGNTPLLLAIKNRFIDIARFLIDSEANIKLKNIEGDSPLLVSIEKGLFDISVVLIEKGADVNEVNKKKTSSLIIAIENQYFDLAKELIAKGVDIKLTDETGSSAIQCTVNFGMTDLLQPLVERGADANLKDKEGVTPASRAIQKGYTDLAKALLSTKDADLKFQLENGDTALHSAVDAGLVEVFELLLEKGIESDIRNKDGSTALIKAAQLGHHRLAFSLIDRKANILIKNINGDSAYLTAAASGMSEVIKRLVAAGVDVNQQDKKGNTALMKALEGRYAETVKCLIERKVNIVTKNNEKNTALLLATEQGLYSVIPLLIGKVDVNIRGASNSTALLKASEKGFADIAQLLIDRGADIHGCDESGRSCLSYACCSASLAPFTTKLLQKDVNILQKDKSGYTPLLRACESGPIHVAAAILFKGASVEDANEDGASPLFYAAERGCYRLVEAIVEKLPEIINQKTKNDETAALKASMGSRGASRILKFLIAKGADIQTTSKDGNFVLKCVAASEFSEMLPQLLPNADFTQRSKTFAASFDDCSLQRMEQFLIAGVNINQKQDDRWGCHALYRAVMSSDCSKFKLLAQTWGADVNFQMNYGYTPLHVAHYGGNKQTFLYLLEKKPKVNLQAYNGDSVLHLVLSGTSLDTAQYYTERLIREKIDLNLQNLVGETPLVVAIKERGQCGLKMARFLVENGAEVSIQAKDGYDALTRLVDQKGDKCRVLRLASLLVDREADLTHQTKEKRLTALELALKNDHLEVVSKIIEKVRASLSFNLEFRKKCSDFLDNSYLTFCKDLDIVRVKYLIENNLANIDALNAESQNGLMIIASTADTRASKKPENPAVLAKAPSADADKAKAPETLDEKTCMTFAGNSKSNTKHIAAYLLSKGISFDTKTSESSMSLCVKFGNFDVLEQIVDFIQNSKETSKASLLSFKKSMLDIFMEGCKTGNSEIVEFVIEKKNADAKPTDKPIKRDIIDINQHDDAGGLGLCYAAENGHVKLFKYLVDHDADILKATSTGLTPLMAASKSDTLDIINFIIEYKGDEKKGTAKDKGSIPNINEKDLDGYNAIMHFAENSKFTDLSKARETFHDLVYWHKGDIYAVTESGYYTTLMAACKGGNTEIINYLVERGVDVNSKNDDEGYTLLMYCSEKGYDKLVSYQIETRKVDIHMTTQSKHTILMAACEGGFIELIKYLISKGADVNAQDDQGFTALMYAACRTGDNTDDIIDLLLEKGADLTLQSYVDLRLNAIELAAKFNNIKILEKFLARVDSSTEANAKMFAYKNGYMKSFRLLQNLVSVNADFAASFISSDRFNLEQVGKTFKAKILKGETLLKGNIDSDNLTEETFNETSLSLRLYMILLDLNSATRVGKADVQAFRTPMTDMASIGALQTYVDLAKSSKKLDFFGSESVKMAIDYAWQSYGKDYHQSLTVLYLLLLTSTSVCNYLFESAMVSDHSWVGYLLLVSILSFDSVFLFMETVDFWHDPLDYISSPSNYVDFIGYGLTFAGTLMRLYYAADTIDSSAVISIATILLWVNLLYYLRPYEATSAVVRLLYVDSLKELYAFIAILLFVLFGFSQSLFVLSLNDSATPFGLPDMAFLNAFAYMMGQADFTIFNSSPNTYLGIFIIVLLISGATIFLLNLLIAILSNSYNTIQSNVSDGIRLERSIVMLNQLRREPPKVDPTIHCIKRLDDIGMENKRKQDKLSIREQLDQTLSESGFTDIKGGIKKLEDEMTAVFAEAVPLIDPVKSSEPNTSSSTVTDGDKKKESKEVSRGVVKASELKGHLSSLKKEATEYQAEVRTEISALKQDLASVKDDVGELKSLILKLFDKLDDTRDIKAFV